MTDTHPMFSRTTADPTVKVTISVTHPVQAIVFSTKSVRDVIFVEAGVYEVESLGVGCDEGQERTIKLVGLPALITRTRFGPTPFTRAMTPWSWYDDEGD